MKFNLLTILIVFTIMSCSVSKQNQLTDEDQIKKVLFDQQAAWNEGDLSKFMIGYWNDEQLKFVGSKGVSYGWQTTLDNYKKGYPNKEKMGVLDFNIISLERLGKSSFYMIGRFELTRKEDKPSGHFTLIWKKIEGEWKIVCDFTA